MVHFSSLVRVLGASSKVQRGMIAVMKALEKFEMGLF